MFIKLLILQFIYLEISATVYTTNTTDLSKCKVHFSRSEAAYLQFFQITNNHRANESLLFDFHFSVIAPRDAHILLSPSSIVGRSDPVYEIVLGAGMNTFSVIRRLQKSGMKTSAKTENLLSSFDVISFWLHVSNEGLIEVGREGEEIAFMSWKDPDPLPIQFFSFCTWPGVEAKWFYDCVREDKTKSDSKEIVRELTTTEKLRKHILSNYDPYLRPVINSEDLTVVHLSMTYERVHLDEMSSKLVIHGTMKLQWTDEKIYWNSSDYDNIQKLHFQGREIWQPDLILYNSASGPGMEFIRSVAKDVDSDGSVVWRTQVHIEAWCDATGLGHWPNDEHVCEMQLGFGAPDDNLLLGAYENSSMSRNYASEWELLDVKSGLYLIPTPWNTDEDKYTGTCVVRFTLKRSSSAYTAVFFAPIFVISISLLVSFWLSAYGPVRISLHCFQLVLLSLVLTKIGTIIPAHPVSVPYLVLLYNYGFIGTLIALLLTIIQTNWLFKMHAKPLPYFLYRFLSLKYIQAILYVRGAKFSESYDKLVDDNGTSNKELDIQVMWSRLGLALDRFFFFMFLIAIIVCLNKRY